MLSPLSSLANTIFIFLKTDDFPAELETASSKGLYLDAKNQVFQQELLSMKLVQKKCKKLERRKKLEQEVVTLRSHTEVNMIEHGQVEQYQQESEERARQDLVEKLREVTMLCRLLCWSVLCLSSLSLHSTFWMYAAQVFPLPPLEQLVL